MTELDAFKPPGVRKMLSLKYVAAAAALALVAQPAFAAPVTFKVQNLATAAITVVSTDFCGTLTPTPTTIQNGTTGPGSTTDCGGSVSASRVDYKGPSGTCRFTINTIYTAPNALTGAGGFWTPTARAIVQSGSPTCRIVSQDVSRTMTTGAFSAVFSLK